MQPDVALRNAMVEVELELREAQEAFPPFRSPHEGLAIILEEYEELKEKVFMQHHIRTQATMREEALHIAAMALRFMVDLT